MASSSSQKMGLWTLVTLVTGNLVGSGVFMLPATLAAFGSICIGGWIVTSLGAIVLSLVFAALSARRPKIGGPHTYVEDAFGKTAGFYVAWGYWVLSWVSNAALVVGAIGYTSSIFGGLSLLTTFMLEAGLIACIAAVNLYGLQVAGRFEFIITVLKLVPLVVVPMIAMFYLNVDNFLPFNGSTFSDFSAINATALLALWAFIGLETGTVPGTDVENPKKNIPRAILIGTLIAAFVYIIGTVAIMGVVPRAELLHAKAPYADLAAILFGGYWGIPVAIVAAICCVGALNGWTMVVGRIALGAANDGLFPAIFKGTTKHGAPLWGIIISSLCSIPFVALSMSESLLKQFNFIIDFSLTLVLVIYLACIAAYFVILKRDHKLNAKAVIIGGLSVAFSLWTLWGASLVMLMWSFIILVAGVPVWLWQRCALKNMGARVAA
ncbi:MAG: amino acid permease [Pseudomonadota bacterium]